MNNRENPESGAGSSLAEHTPTSESSEPMGALSVADSDLIENIRKEIESIKSKRINLTQIDYKSELQKCALDVNYILLNAKMNGGTVIEIGALTRLYVELLGQIEKLDKEEGEKVVVRWEIRGLDE